MNRLDLLSPPVRANPYPHYAELRRSAPVTQVDPGGVWAVSRARDIVHVMKHPERFSSQGLRPMTIQPWLARNPLADSLVLMDPPRHTGIRALVARAFGNRVVPRIEPLARRVCREFVARVRQGGELEVCDALASHLPGAVISDLLGLDQERVGHMRRWSDDLISVNPATPPDMQPRILATVAELERYLVQVLAERRAEPRDDLVSDLLDAEVDGQRLSEAELVSFLFLLVVAGFETTMHLLTNSLRLLAGQPELLHRLRAQPASIPGFVEEMLRYDPSVHGTMRLSLTDEEIGGVRIPAGSVMLMLLGSANRDEELFADPDRFDMDRVQRTAIPFGHGIHFCLGAALARAETRIALEELVPHVASIRLVREPVWNYSMTVRGPTSCVMELVPRRA